MNLSEKFYAFLTNQRIMEFTTREAREWYHHQKRNPSTKPDYTNLAYLILRPLVDKGLIKKVNIGQYMLLLGGDPQRKYEASKLQEESTQAQDNEDKEFFNYVASKLKGGLKE